MRLTTRERSWAIGLALFITAYLAYALVLEPAWQRTTDLQRVIPEKLATLQQVHTKAAQVQHLQQQIDLLQQSAANQPTTPLLATVQQAIQHANLTPCLDKMTPTRQPLDAAYALESVSADLNQITLQQLLPLLTHLQTNHHSIRLQSLHLQKTPTKGRWNASLQISRLKLNTP